MKKISPLQFITILLCCKLFSIMTYIPDKNENGIILILTAITATIIQGVLAIPIILYYKKNNGESIFSFISAKNKTISVITSVLFLIVSIWALIESLGNISFFLQYCFSDTYAPWAVVIVIAAAAFYIAHTGIATLARTTGIIAVITLISLILVLAGFKHHIDFVELNFAVRHPVLDIIKGVPKFLSGSQELVAFVILLNALQKQPSKTIYGYLSLKLLITIISIVAVVTVLGDYTYLSKLPFFTLSSFSQTKIIEHYESFFMIFWTLCAVIKVTLFTICSEYCLYQIFPRLKQYVGTGLSLIAASASVIPILMLEKWETIAFPRLQAIIMVLLIGVIPLILLFFKNRKNRQEG